MRRLAEGITRTIDLFYVRPVAAVVPRQVFRYAACGGANIVVGWVLYYLIYHLLLEQRPVDVGPLVVSAHVAAMLLCFPATFLLGFWLNRRVAFSASALPSGVQLLRYGLSVAGSVGVNYVCLKVFVDGCGFWATPSQMLATGVTTVYSFLAAKYFTFRV